MNKEKAVIVSEIKNVIINLLSNDNEMKFQLIEKVDRERVRNVTNYGDNRQESTLKENLCIIFNKIEKKDFQEVEKTVLADISVELEEIDKMVRGINITNSDKQGIMRIADNLHELCTRCYDVLDTK